MDKNESSPEPKKLNSEDVQVGSQIAIETNSENITIIGLPEGAAETEDITNQVEGPIDNDFIEEKDPDSIDERSLEKSNNSGLPPDSPKHKKRWLKRLILGLMLSFLTFGAIGFTQSPSASFICESCHEMKPEIATWKVSDHSRIACINCHTDVGPTHFFQKNHYTKKYYLPIQVKSPVSNEVCENCHSQNRTVTPRGDLIVPHQKHEEQGLDCTTCHIGVAHGGIAERQETIDGDFNRWDEVTGRQNMSWQYKTMSMNDCLKCHKDRNGPQDCEACHSRIVPPPSHQTEDWVKKGLHGQEAFKDLKSCDECHSYSMNLVRVPNDDKVISYARSNSFCVSCHVSKPPSHNEKPFLHGDKASQDQRVCLVCHEKTTAKKANVATKTVCISCHKQQHSLPKFHPVPIRQGVGPINSCYRCHPQNRCTKCHK